jgi:hypothetical protein
MESSSKVKAERRKVKGLLSPFKGLGLGLLLLTATATPSKAQSFDDWFEQGKTLIKNMEKQMAALSACETAIKQGYNIVNGELSSIKNFKNGELTLHQNYYSSLNQVNPQVKNSTDMITIGAEQQSIISQFNAIGNLPGLSTSEQTYIQGVAQNLIAELAKDLNELQTVLTPGQLVMSDDERIKRISKVTASVKDKYVFTCTFCTQVRVLAVQKNEDGNDNGALQKLYGINP